MTPRPSRLEGLSRLLTVIVTNGTKVVGLIIGFKAAPTGDPVTFGFAALCVAGGQLSEGALLGVIERFFAVQRETPKGRSRK